MGQVIPLNLLRGGEAGEVVEIHGNEKLVARLAERGLRRGSRLEVLTPGEPILCMVGATRLSFRTNGQIEVMVRLGQA